MHTKAIYFSALLALPLSGTVLADAQPTEDDMGMTMMLFSGNFSHLQAIPRHYTCQGADVSPNLTWTSPPPNTKSLVLIVDDPDAPDPAAPQMTWVHWLLYNIPPDIDELAENILPEQLPPGTLQGKNDWHQTGYKGPCPPTGTHRYFFKLYALNVVLPDLHAPDKVHLEEAMFGHIAGWAELIGTYRKQ